jgi:hypothetical protein
MYMGNPSLAKGAGVNVKNWGGQMPLDMAISRIILPDRTGTFPPRHPHAAHLLSAPALSRTQSKALCLKLSRSRWHRGLPGIHKKMFSRVNLLAATGESPIQ